ncbi:hypothetical protein VPH35_101258 [Triticum aestivum]|nr:BTB/POZ domain-containing protein At4g01160-like [Aegilops tauschii subsp. strangulata]
MGLDISRGGGLPSFKFAFNSENFSDRVLRLEAIASDGARPRRTPPRLGVPPRGAPRRGSRKSIDSSWTIVSAPVLRVKNIYINSVVFATNSPFFLKLFTNGMKESDLRHLTLRIADSGKQERRKLS